eukprot:scaffold31792_cov168-Amphora_coffeaeformis.AAC.8
MEDQAAACPAVRKATARENFMVVTNFLGLNPHYGAAARETKGASASRLGLDFHRFERVGGGFVFDSH